MEVSSSRFNEMFCTSLLLTASTQLSVPQSLNLQRSTYILPLLSCFHRSTLASFQYAMEFRTWHHICSPQGSKKTCRYENQSAMSHWKRLLKNFSRTFLWILQTTFYTGLKEFWLRSTSSLMLGLWYIHHPIELSKSHSWMCTKNSKRL